MTDDPDVRIATSVLDYLFRRLALDYLPYEKRAQLGIFSAEERTAQVAAPTTARRTRRSTSRACAPRSTPQPPRRRRRRRSAGRRSRWAAPPSCWSCSLGKAADAPLCMTCGTKMRPAGSCYLCEGCGSTSGCS